MLEFFKNKSIPIATVIGGGYSNDKLEFFIFWSLFDELLTDE